MDMRITGLLLAFTLLSTACAANDNGTNTDRAVATQSQTALNVETLVDNLAHPWSVAVLPNADFLVTERGGRLLQFSSYTKSNTGSNNGTNTGTEISGLPDDIYVQGQAGLFDVILAPDFKTSGYLYLSYARGTKKANRTALLKARLVNGSLVDSEIIFQVTPTKDTSSHFGARLAWLPDGSLVMSTGEGFAYREAAQDMGSDLGKIIRINPDGSIPADNPFRNTANSRPEIYSLGHRNPQGLHFDSISGRLWAHEHGPKGGDELNIITPGRNYGWPIATTGIDYNGAKITPYQSYEGMTPFIKDWVPSIAPSGLTIYRGTMFADWDGDAFVGGLASRDLRRVDLENGKFVAEEILLTDLHARIRDVRTAPDGSLLVLTDAETDGKLLRLTPK